MTTKFFNVKNGITTANLSVGSNLTVTGNVSAGNISATDISGNTLGGNLTTAAQPNITSVGTLTALTVSGISNLNSNSNVIITGGTAGQYLKTDGSGNLSWDSPTSGLSNGTSNVSIPVAGGNVNTSVDGVANVFVVTSTGANISGTVNASGNANLGNLGTAGAITATGNVSGGNLSTGGTLSVTGNANVGNIGATNGVFSLVTGTLVTAAQPNVTSLGTLSGLDVNGNIVAANITANTGVFTGNGSGLSAIAGGNITGAVANATHSNTSNTVVDAAQPNITSVGTLSSLVVSGNANVGNLDTVTGVFTGNITANNLSTTNSITAGNGFTISAGGANITGNVSITGNMTVTGNLNYSNVTDLVVGDPLIFMGANNSGDTVDLGFVAEYNDGNEKFTGLARDASEESRTWILFTNLANQPTETVDFANASTAPLKTGAFTSTSTITATGNVSGGNLTTAGALSVTGNANVGNIGAAAGVFTTVSGNGSALTSLDASNISSGTLSQSRLANANLTLGNTTLTLGDTITTVTGLTSVTSTTFIGNLTGEASTAGTVTTAAQPNITSTGTLTGITLATNGDITMSGTDSQLSGANLVSASFLTGTLTTASQPNITSVGTLSSLSVTANISGGNLSTAGILSVTGNANVGNLGTAGLIVATGNIDGGNLNTTGVVAATGNLSGGNISTAGILSVTGNANVGNIGGGIGVFTGNIDAANLNTTGVVSATGNVSGGNLTTAGALVATGNVSGGNLTTAGALNVTGNANVGNIGTTDLVITGNVTGNLLPSANVTYNLGSDTQRWNNLYLNGNTITLGSQTISASETQVSMTGTISGNGQGLANLNANNLTTGTVNTDRLSGNYTITVVGSANTVRDSAQGNITSLGTLTGLDVNGNIVAANITANTGVFTGNGSGLSALAGANVTGTVANATHASTANTIVDAAQPNITSVGTLTDLSVSGNAIISGNLTVDGNIAYVNVETLAVEDPIIQLQTGPNGAAPSSNTGKDVGTALNYYDTEARVAFMGWDISNSEFGLASQASISSEVVTFTTYGNLRVGNIIGNGQALSGLSGANVTGTVANATHASTANTVVDAAQGNITSLGTLTGLDVNGNITAANITANTGVFTGNGSGLSALAGANVTGNVGTALVAYSVDAANVSGLGNIATINLDGSGSNVLLGNGSWAPIAGGTYNDSNVVSLLASFGSNSISTTGNIGAGNISGNGSGLSALAGANVTGQVANALVASTVYTNAQPNITSVGTLSSLTVSGQTNLGNAGNVKIEGGSANYVLQTDGAGNLTWAEQSGGGGGNTTDAVNQAFALSYFISI